MKHLFSHKNYLALIVAIAAAASSTTQAQENPIPPPAAEAALPPNIADNTPSAQVIKLVQAGVEIGTIKNFVTNSANPFDLDAAAVIAMNDAGVPTEIINAMLEHDKKMLRDTATPPPAPASNTTVVTTPPEEPVTVNYFYSSLTPYGSWVEVNGYGRCWRPTVVVYDNSWRPYCDRGRWVYTDCGWYWDSDYSWGVTFHYGRWFRDTRFGWCWYPDTQWAPSWVTFRSGGDYCGWAPLPPLAVFRPGGGFFYRGASVSVGFDFGLGSDCFTFVSSSRFCDRHPRSHCVEPQRVTQVFQHTTIINNYNVNRTTVVNNGIPVTQVGDRQHHPIKPVQVASLPNAERQGWRGENHNRNRPDTTDNRNGSPRNNGNGHSQSDNHNQTIVQSGHEDGKRPGGSAKMDPQPDNNTFRNGSVGRNNGDKDKDSDHRPNSRPTLQTGGGIRVAPGTPVQPSDNHDNQNNRIARDNTTTATTRDFTPNSPANNNWVQNKNNSHEITRPAPSTDTGRSTPQKNDWRSSRNVDSPKVTQPATRPAPSMEQRQFTPPGQNREQKVESRGEQRIQPSPRAVETAPRIAPQPSTPAPSQAQNSDRSSNRGNDRSNDRGSDRGNSQRSDKDRNK